MPREPSDKPKEKVSDWKRRQLRLDLGDLRVMFYEREVDDLHFPLWTLGLEIWGDRSPLKVMLDSFTAEELEALRDFLNDGLDRAIAASRELDRKAQGKLDEHGNITEPEPRLYRGVPRRFDTTRAVRTDGESLWVRPESAS